ncbi:MAG: hypothetical protein L3K08_01920 [Thermoplasmata archaeon]|nr:hypothetical protein [Thermoplasmata archaeon]
MAGSTVDWVRGRGIGRERLAGHIGDFLTGYGFTIDRSESTEPPETRVKADLAKMNPSVPESGRHFEFRLYPNSGGCAIEWVSPLEVPTTDRSRFDRLARELQQYLERIVSTESHGTAKLSTPPGGRRPWDGSAVAPGAGPSPSV